MCLSCGCQNPDDNHHNPDNITTTALIRAARAANLTPLDTIRNIIKALPLVIKRLG